MTRKNERGRVKIGERSRLVGECELMVQRRPIRSKDEARNLIRTLRLGLGIEARWSVEFLNMKPCYLVTCHMNERFDHCIQYDGHTKT